MLMNKMDSRNYLEITMSMVWIFLSFWTNYVFQIEI